MRRLFTCLLLLFGLFLLSSWGFFAHQQINRMAVFTLPKEMIRFYKSNISYITEHAVDADKRRYADTAEATRHFIDIDRYGPAPFDSLPQKWIPAVAKYSEQTLKDNGSIPWQIERSYYSLVKAFQERDSAKILRVSANLGHYIGDAHVPLHTTENYNGQLSNQVGIHAFVAGVGKMNLGKFTYFNIVGALLWIISFLGLGFVFGNIPVIKDNFTYVMLVIIVLTILPAIFAGIKTKRDMKKSAA